MWWKYVCALVVGLLLSPSSKADENPRDLLVKAVEAQGGEARLTRAPALYRKLKGRYFSEAGPLEGESYHQYPGYYKDVVRLIEQPETPPFLYMITPEKGYLGPQDSAQEISGAAFTELRLGSYKDHLTDLLLGLLHDKSAQLTALPGGTVHDRPAVGLHYRSKTYGEMDLYFDQAAGFLVKMAYVDQAQVMAQPRKRKVIVLVDKYQEPDWEGVARQALKRAGYKSDNAALLDLLQKQTLDLAGQRRLQEWITQLGDDSYDVREKATRALIACGVPALSYLQRANKDPDPEVKRRVRHCLEEIDRPERRELLQNALVGALQLITLRKPPDAAGALLAYLPQARDETVKKEVLNALEAVAKVDGRPNPAIEAALASKDSPQRLAARAVLGNDGGTFARRAERRMYVTGVKLPTKFTWLIDGEKTTEWEITEFRFYNAFDKSVFAHP